LPRVGIAPKLVEFASGLLTQQDNRETAGFRPVGVPGRQWTGRRV